jgi:hypothetical protein
MFRLFWGLVLSMTTLGVGIAQAQPNVSGPLLVMHAGPLARPGSYRFCVILQTSTGTPLTQALKACDFDNNGWDRGDPLDSANWPGVGTGGSRPTGTSSVNCASAGVNPAIAQREAPLPADLKNSTWYTADTGYKNAVDNYEEKYNAYQVAEGKYYASRITFGPLSDITWDAVNKFFDATVAKMDAWLAVDKAETAAIGLTSQNDKKRVVPGMESSCQQIAEFVYKCNVNGWRTPECKKALDRITSCGDPMVTDPIPTAGVGAGTGGCNVPAADPGTVKKAWVVHCDSRIKPLPGVDPCAPLQVEGTIHTFVLHSGGGKPCGDPRALTEANQCTGSITLTEFGERDIQKIAEELAKKTHGPVFIVPQPGPRDDPHPGGGPRGGPK